jgi:hypothetical protein
LKALKRNRDHTYSFHSNGFELGSDGKAASAEL